MEESSDKATALKKAYAEMILNTAKESAARVMVSDRKSVRFHNDLCGTKDEALRLLVRLKQMIDAKTIEGEIISANQQRQIDVLEAQLQEAEDIITDLRSELRWVRDKLEKAKEEEPIDSHSEVVVVVASLNSPNEDLSESVLNQSLLNDEKSVEISKGCDDVCVSEMDANITDKLEKTKEQEATDSHSEFVVVVTSLDSPNVSESVLNQSLLNDEESIVEISKGCGDSCESELEANIRNKKLELSRNGFTQRIRAFETNSSSLPNDKDSEENLSSENTRCLVLALRAKDAEVITAKPLNAPGIKKSCKLRGRRKKKWSKGKAKPVRSQSQLIKPCQSQSDLPCSKTSMENSDDMEMNLSVDNEEVDGFNPTDHMVEACQESNLVAVYVEDGENKVETNTKPISRLNPVVSVDVTNGSTDKDMKSREEAALVKCNGEADSVVVPSTKMSSELVNPCSDLKATAVVSNQITESPRTEGNRIVKYTFQRKRKRDL